MVNRKKSREIEGKIVEGCCKGSIRDFEKLFDLYGDKILNYIHSYINGDLETSKDLMQETFISVYNGINKLNNPDKFTNWIYTIASNKCRDYLRDQKNSPVVDSTLLEKIEDTRSKGSLKYSDNALDMEMINEITDKMPVKVREVFLMRKYEHMGFNEVCRAAGCSLRAAKYRMKKAVNILSRELQKRGFNFGS